MFQTFLRRNAAQKDILAEAALVSQRQMERRFRERAVAVSGTVIGIDNEIRQLKNGDNLIFEYPRVRFVTASGQEIVFRSPHGYTPCRAQVGDGVTVFYNHANPYDARVD